MTTAMRYIPTFLAKKTLAIEQVNKYYEIIKQNESITTWFQISFIFRSLQNLKPDTVNLYNIRIYNFF